MLDRTRDRGHGRVELRTLKAVTVHHFGFPHAAQVILVTRKTRDLGTRRWRTVTVYAITSLTFERASPATWPITSVGTGRSSTACTTSATPPSPRTPPSCALRFPLLSRRLPELVHWTRSKEEARQWQHHASTHPS